jgi:predicted nucleotidyltransferase
MLPIEILEKKLNVKWPNIRNARERSNEKRAELSARVSKYSEKDSTVVVFSSLARNEFTDGSDIDWTLLVDGRAKSEHFTIKNEIADVIHRMAKVVGQAFVI